MRSRRPQQKYFGCCVRAARLHLVDIGGDTTSGGLMARLIRHSPHVAGNLGDAIPRLLRSAGFDCTELATERHRFVGRLTYYRATRPV